jgi:hypothetical protein
MDPRDEPGDDGGGGENGAVRRLALRQDGEQHRDDEDVEGLDGERGDGGHGLDPKRSMSLPPSKFRARSDVGSADPAGGDAPFTWTGVFGLQIGGARLTQDFRPATQAALDAGLAKQLGGEGGEARHPITQIRRVGGLDRFGQGVAIGRGLAMHILAAAKPPAALGQQGLHRIDLVAHDQPSSAAKG